MRQDIVCLRLIGSKVFIFITPAFNRRIRQMLGVVLVLALSSLGTEGL